MQDVFNHNGLDLILIDVSKSFA